jgi:hypothetical protein
MGWCWREECKGRESFVVKNEFVVKFPHEVG